VVRPLPKSLIPAGGPSPGGSPHAQLPHLAIVQDSTGLSSSRAFLHKASIFSSPIHR